MVEKKRKENFMLFSDHNGSLLRRQPGAQRLVATAGQLEQLSACRSLACCPWATQVGAAGSPQNFQPPYGFKVCQYVRKLAKLQLSRPHLSHVSNEPQTVGKKSRQCCSQGVADIISRSSCQHMLCMHAYAQAQCIAYRHVQQDLSHTCVKRLRADVSNS